MMSDQPRGWYSYTSADSPSTATSAPRHQPPEAVATIQIIVNSTRPGDSEVRIGASSDGPFSTIHDPNSAKRAAALKQLYSLAHPALKNAVELLAD